ncbi:hypothetical protein [Haloparvum sedimenti]|uniref:hypothetical protein n=1 Tax=Haloparvum sedimenti TaxID=1678448 RepID=UPI00159ECDC8|nr:hypothetical protein [Haloparvum sedimenti]
MTDPTAREANPPTGDGPDPTVEHASMDAAPELFAGGSRASTGRNGGHSAPTEGDG